MEVEWLLFRSGGVSRGDLWLEMSKSGMKGSEWWCEEASEAEAEMTNTNN